MSVILGLAPKRPEFSTDSVDKLEDNSVLEEGKPYTELVAFPL